MDTITGFRTGALANGGDVLNFNAFNGKPAGLRALDTANPETSATIADKTIVRLIDLEDGQDITTAAGLLAALNGGEYANIDATSAGTTTYVFLTASSAAATTFNVFYATSANTSADFATVELVGTVSANAGLGTLVAANFA